ncbi:MAG: polyhydroxybutyrate depolymerase [Woeseiaceae bacterium]|nr:polyhydroxybutyrate depolymerase [Woeseiaceae bacterium]
MSRLTAAVCVLLAVSTIAGCGKPASDGNAPAGLPALAAQPDVTVSGASSGAYMATQYHVAYSSHVTGAAFIAGGPWGCARGQLTRALGACIKGDGIDAGLLASDASALADAGAIDALKNLQDDRVFLFHGTRDEVVARDTVAAAGQWYATAAGIDARFEDTVPVTHGMPTVDYGAPCPEFRAPYLNACEYDLAGELLEYLHGDLNPPADAAGSLREFNQRADSAAGLAETGYVYVPDSCAQGLECRVHVFFHGCGQSVLQIGDELAANAGFNRWAAANNLIVLYPQVAPSRLSPQNPLACWDWWGYSGEDYLTQQGAQLAAVRAMVRQLTAPRR